MTYNVLNVIAYEVCLWLIGHRQSFRMHPLVKRVMTHCFEDWVNWKTHTVMMDVNEQAEDLKQRWEQEEAEKSVEKFSEIFPHAKVTPHEKFPGAVLIEHEDGAMEIKSPWSDPG